MEHGPLDAPRTRRELLVGAAAGLATLLAPTNAWSRLAAAAVSDAAGKVYKFVSEPALRPPFVQVTTRAHPSSGYVFVASLNGPGQRGPLIVDNEGSVVWFRRVDPVAINFGQQVYRGKPVLTWWEGTITKIGIGQGVGVIVDQSYRTVARVAAGNGLHADVHEFLLTPAGTALLTAFNPVQVDLTPVGKPGQGTVLDSIVQEVDVGTGAVLFEWHSLDHVPLTDTYSPVLDPFDYFHANSIDVDVDGNLLVSARNTSAVYKLDRRTGAVIWTLGGRRSDFALGANAAFMYQHDARAHADGTMTIFDDGPPSRPSRAIRLGVDLGEMRADLLQQYLHPTPLSASAMGNAQVLAGDAVFVGWGTEPYVTEFGPAGDVRFDAQLAGNAWNYRAFRNQWVGRPAAPPSVVVRRSTRSATMYASWNGSTETAFWRIAGGPTKATARTLRLVARSGFETEIPIAGRHRVLAVTPLDANRRPLAAPVLIAG